MFEILFSIANFQNFINYEIFVDFDDSLNIIKGYETIYYINNSKDTLKYIELNLYANAFRPNSKYNQDIKNKLKVKKTEIDKAKPKDWGYIIIDSCSEKFDTNDMLMRVYKTILPNETSKIFIKFTLKIPKLFDRLGKSENEYEITQWYPKVGVYDERGWRTYGYRYNTEFYGDYANWKVSIKVPKDYVVGSSGYLVDSIVNDSFKVLTYKLEKAHDFAFVMSKRYKVEEINYDSIKIYILHYSNDSNFVKIAKYHSINALKIFSKKLYPYPYKSLTIVESHLRAGGGMEYPALVLITNPKEFRSRIFRLTNSKNYYLAIVIAHEIGHQWFYGIIGNDEAYEAWLDEGMNSYLEDYYNHLVFNNESIYNVFGIFKKIMKFYLGDYDFRLFGDYFVYLEPYDEPMLGKPAWEMKNYWQVYNRGKNLMLALQDIIGDSLFDIILKEYFKKYAFKHPRSEDFIKLVEETSKLDLTAFKNQWLYGKGLPNYSVYKTNNDKFLIKGTYKYPVSVLIDNKLFKLKPDTIISAKSVIIDPFNNILESDEWDNTYPRRFEFKPFFNIPKMGYYQISYIPFIFYNPFDNYFFGIYLRGSESYKRHFFSYGGNTKGDFYLSFWEKNFSFDLKFIKNIFNFDFGLKNKYIQFFVFNDYINDLSYLDENYFQKANVWGIKINGFYKNLKIFSKISKNFIKLNINYNFNILKMINIQFSYYRIFGNYPIYERIYIDGGFLYPRAFEILLPYKGDWFYSKYLVFNDGIYSKRGENIFSDEFAFLESKISPFGIFGVYSSVGWTGKIYVDYGIYLKLYKVEFKFVNFNSFVIRLNF